jgi:hypothetical protein
MGRIGAGGMPLCMPGMCVCVVPLEKVLLVLVLFKKSLHTLERNIATIREKKLLVER